LHQLKAYEPEQMLNNSLPVNLALSFARRGIRTGILDTDIFGPSIPTLLNLSGEPRLDESNILPSQ
jgi:ATP-binding protein involved in chromosome partitioning